MFISMTLLRAMNVSGAGRHGWAPMNSANLYGGGDGGVCVCVLADDVSVRPLAAPVAPRALGYDKRSTQANIRHVDNPGQIRSGYSWK